MKQPASKAGHPLSERRVPQFANDVQHFVNKCSNPFRTPMHNPRTMARHSQLLHPQREPAALRPAAGSSLCEWKGVARYFDVLAGSVTAPRAAWAYDHPTARFADLAGHVAFYAGQLDEAWVGNARVIPQPGNFYGGWVTPNLDGRIKGAPGTQHW